MGDFNAYGEEDPLDRLRASGLAHRAPLDAYTHGYASMFGALDHAFTTVAMGSAITGSAVWHINTDEPSTLDYRDANQSRYQPNAFRSSDHDPLLVGFDGSGLAVGIAEERQKETASFSLQGTLATWFPQVEGAANGAIELFDVRGMLVRSIPQERARTIADLAGLAPGLYTWRGKGYGVGRFIL